MTTEEPISRLPLHPPEVKLHRLVLTATFVITALVVTSTVIVAVQIMAAFMLASQLPLWIFMPRFKQSIKLWFYQQYKSIIRYTERTFASCLVVLFYFVAPKTKLVLSGDFEDLKEAEKTILMANHQIYPDWIYIWLLARRFNRHGDLKIMLIAVLRLIPLFGWGMLFFEFIFMHRKFKDDYKTILNMMERQRTLYAHFPLWMLIFPEGTLNTPNNRATSKSFAKKNNITDDPKYVLLPKVAGLFMVAECLKGQVDYLFDITVGYSGLDKIDIPYEEYLIENVLFKNRYPQEIHMHVRKYVLNSIPGVVSDIPFAMDDKKFTGETESRKNVFGDWVQARYMEKDEFMRVFYEDGRFEAAEQVFWSPKPDIQDVLTLAVVWVAGITIIPIVYTVLKTFLIMLIY